MASSNTVLSPRCVKAEHSRYFTESAGRKAGAGVGRKGARAGSGGSQEFTAKGAQKRNMQEEYHSLHLAERDAHAWITHAFLAHVTSQPQHLSPSVSISQHPPKNALNLVLR